eukprot:5047416-Lingulodinium_polyedra.AAC.1
MPGDLARRRPIGQCVEIAILGQLRPDILGVDPSGRHIHTAAIKQASAVATWGKEPQQLCRVHACSSLPDACAPPPLGPKGYRHRVVPGLGCARVPSRACLPLVTRRCLPACLRACVPGPPRTAPDGARVQGLRNKLNGTRPKGPKRGPRQNTRHTLKRGWPQIWARICYFPTLAASAALGGLRKG